MNFNSDVDIDFGDRDKILNLIKHIPASIQIGDNYKKHNTGVYVTGIPINPMTGSASIEYSEAEKRGYLKLDFLNVWIYQHIKSEEHLIELMAEPNWELLNNEDFFEKLIHIGRHRDVFKKMPEPIDSIPRMAMFLSLIRPGKRHLIGHTWKEVSKTIWDNENVEGYWFKKSHAIAYAQLVVVNMNLIEKSEEMFNSIVLPE